MPRVILVALVVFATIYALVDCLQTDGAADTHHAEARVAPRSAWSRSSGRSCGSSPEADAPGSRGSGPGPRGNTPAAHDATAGPSWAG